jgi:hypothetical protein
MADTKKDKSKKENADVEETPEQQQHATPNVWRVKGRLKKKREEEAQFLSDLMK